tara:strand:- start:582 stop:1454 length:873 start_codon:yes stop_codon:yes gene_type:complete
MIYNLLKLLLPFKIKEFIKYFFFIKNYNLNNKVSININGHNFYIPKSDYKLENNIYFRIIKKENEQIDKIKKVHNFFKTDIIVDIGANIGYWSLIRYLNIHEIKKIFCFEPSKISFNYLSQNLKYYNNCKVFNIGFGNSNDIKKLSFPYWENKKSYRIQNLGLRSIHGGTNILSEEISIKKFDDFYKNLEIENISVFIKIDTEGYEFEVLKGMQDFIINSKKIIFEIEFNTDIYNNISKDLNNEILNYLKKNNFDAYSFKDNQITKINYSQINNAIYKNTENYYFKKINL